MTGVTMDIGVFHYCLVLGICILFTYAVEVLVASTVHGIEYNRIQLDYKYEKSIHTAIEVPTCIWYKIIDGTRHEVARYAHGFNKVADAFKDSVRIDNTSLVLDNITRLDAGLYECEVEIFDDEPPNDVGKVTVTVSYLDAPTIDLPEIVVDGDACTVFCYSGDADPKPLLMMFKGLQMIDSIIGNILNYTKSNVSKDDADEYHCTATNKAGSKKSAINMLNVIYCSIESFRLENGQLVCISQSHPVSNTSIFVDDQEVSSTGGISTYCVENDCNPSLNIYCTVTNGYQTKVEQLGYEEDTEDDIKPAPHTKGPDEEIQSTGNIDIGYYMMLPIGLVVIVVAVSAFQEIKAYMIQNRQQIEGDDGGMSKPLQQTDENQTLEDHISNKKCLTM